MPDVFADFRALIPERACRAAAQAKLPFATASAFTADRPWKVPAHTSQVLFSFWTHTGSVANCPTSTLDALALVRALVMEEPGNGAFAECRQVKSILRVLDLDRDAAPAAHDLAANLLSGAKQCGKRRLVETARDGQPLPALKGSHGTPCAWPCLPIGHARAEAPGRKSLLCGGHRVTGPIGTV